MYTSLRGDAYMATDKVFVVLEFSSVLSARYAVDVLGHGGCNTFPEYSGICGSCGVDIRSNAEKSACPSCGNTKNYALEREESFGSWSQRTRGDSISTGCEFINR